MKTYLDNEEGTASTLADELSATGAEIQAVIRKSNPEVIGKYRSGDRGRASSVYSKQEMQDGLIKYRAEEKAKSTRLKALGTSEVECSQASFAVRFGEEYDIDRGKLGVILKTQEVAFIAKVGKTQIYSIQDVVLAIAAWRKAEDEKYARAYDPVHLWTSDDIAAALEAKGLERKFVSQLVNLLNVQPCEKQYRPHGAKQPKNLYSRDRCEQAIITVNEFRNRSW
jgi:hypothetical protein